MGDVLRLRQRRFSLVQMQAESDLHGEPCLLTADNNKDDGSVFGPYLETCPGKPENRGCYDVQMTTRDVRKLEFSTCMEAAGSNQLWQFGNSYDHDFTSILSIQDNLCELDYEEQYKWSKAEIDGIPIKVLASDDADEDIIAVLDTDNIVWIRGYHHNDQQAPWWIACISTICLDGEYIEDNFVCYESVEVIVEDIVGFIRYTVALVIDVNGFVYSFHMGESCSIFYDPTDESHETDLGACVFFTSDRQVENSYFMYVLKSNPIQAIVWNWDEDEYERINHPEGKNFINGSVTNRNSILIDEDGDVWVKGENLHCMLGFPQAVVELYTLTKVDGLTQPIVKSVSSSSPALSFLFTDLGTVYSAGDSYYDSVDKICTGLIGRRCSYDNTGNTFSAMRHRFKDISVIANRAIAIHTDGTLWGWGRGDDCNLGLTTKFLAHTGGFEWIPDPILLSYDTDWADISTHADGCSAVKLCTGTVGTPKLSSNTQYGQLTPDGPYGDWFGQQEFSGIPTDKYSYKAMAVGAKHAMYVTQEGLLFVGGSIEDPSTMGGYIQSGDIENIKYVYQIEKVKYVFAYMNSSAYTDEYGRFFVVGADIPVVEGVGDDSGSFYLEFTEIPFDSPVREFRCFDNEMACMVLLENGEIWAWGINNGHCLGVGNNLENIMPPRKINGLYVNFSVGQIHGAAISISGALMMWGTDNNKGQGWGLFGQGNDCDELLWDPDIPTMTLEEPTLVRPSNIYFDGRPRHFREVLCNALGTFLIIDETDTEFLDDELWGEPYPRWCKGDVWATGQGETMTGVYQAFNKGGCWGIIIAGEDCFRRNCIEGKAYKSQEVAEQAYLDDPLEAASWYKDGTYSGDVYMWNSTRFCPFWMVDFIIDSGFQSGHADLDTIYSGAQNEIVNVIIRNNDGSGELWINDWNGGRVELDWEENAIATVTIVIMDQRGLDTRPEPETYFAYYEVFDGGRGGG